MSDISPTISQESEPSVVTSLLGTTSSEPSTASGALSTSLSSSLPSRPVADANVTTLEVTPADAGLGGTDALHGPDAGAPNNDSCTGAGIECRLGAACVNHLCVAPVCDGTLSLGGPTGQRLTSGAYAITQGELTGEGATDLAVSTQLDVLVLRNLGAGSFDEEARIPFAARALISADLNSDGMLDLAAVNEVELVAIFNYGSGHWGRPQVLPTTGVYPTALAAGDLDGDGDIDLLTANRGDNTINVLMNQGNGSFETARAYETGEHPNAIAAEDFDADGDLDVAVTNFFDESVSLFLNDGTGVLSSGTDFPCRALPTSIAAGDMNRDGTADLIVTHQDDQVSVFHNLGEAIFDSGSRFSVGSTPRSIAVADFDANQHLDIATADQNGAVSLLTSTATDAFSLQQLPAGRHPFGLVAADFNSDSVTDLAVTNEEGSDVNILLAQGGAWTSPEPYGIGPEQYLLGWWSRSAATADLDGDGLLDVAVTAPNSQRVYLLMNPGDGRFNVALGPTTGNQPYSIATADFDLDGRNDLVVGNQADGTVSVFHNLGGARFDAGTVLNVSSAPMALAVGDLDGRHGADLVVATWDRVVTYVSQGDGILVESSSLGTAGSSSVEIGDLDADGRNDLVLSDGNGVWITSGSGDGGFAAPIRIDAERGVVGLTIADFDADADLDIALAEEAANRVRLLRNFGNLHFELLGSFEVPLGPSSVVASDVDADGLVDVVVAGLYAGDDGAQINVLLNQNNQGFALPFSYSVAGNPNDLLINDFDRDGRQDVLTVGVNAITFFRNTCRKSSSWQDSECTPGSLMCPPKGACSGVGCSAPRCDSNDVRLTSVGRLRVGKGPNDLAIGDLNGDHTPDLVTPNVSSESVSVLLNAADAGFTLAQQSAAEEPVDSMVTFDANGDGTLDLASTASLSDRVSVMLGNGDGSFSQPTNYDAPHEPFGIDAADLNGDDYPDLVYVNLRNAALSVLLGSGDGSFGDATTFPVPTDPRALSLADLNADGARDIVVEASNSSPLVILWGHGDGTFDVDARAETPGSLLVTDVNRDGLPDILGSNLLGQGVGYLENQGDGLWAPVVGLLPTEQRWNFFSFTTAQIDADEYFDLAALSDRGVTVLRGNGHGAFEVADSYPIGLYPRSLHSVDLNLDGAPELVATNFEDESIRVLTNRGDGSFYQEGFSDMSPWHDRVAGTWATGDLDGDQRPDEVQLSGVWLELQFTNGQQLSYMVPHGAISVALADLNQDGSLDVAVTNPGGVLVFFNAGGRLAPPVTYDIQADTDSILATDLDADGDLDLVFNDFFGQSIGVLRNRGAGQFGLVEFHPTDVPSHALASADFDLDGFPDVAVVSSTEATLTVLLNQAGLGFGSPASYPVGSAAFSIAATDLNGDDVPDLAVANRDEGGGLTLFMNEGHGAFSPTHFNTLTAPVGVSAYDFNHDGRDELVVTGRYEDEQDILLTTCWPARP